MDQTRNRTIVRSAVVTATFVTAGLFLVACGSDGNATDTSVIGDPAETQFVAQAENACGDTQNAIDALLAQSGDPDVDPQPAVVEIAGELHQLYDRVSAIESLEEEVSQPTETYLSAVLASAEEADDAAASKEAAAIYLESMFFDGPSKLVAANQASQVLGIAACDLEF